MTALSQANTRGRVVDQTKFEELGVDDKAITGAAVSEIRADVISFQEVENVDTLKHFRARSRGGRRAYPRPPPAPGEGPTSGRVTGNCPRHKPQSSTRR